MKSGKYDWFFFQTKIQTSVKDFNGIDIFVSEESTYRV